MIKSWYSEGYQLDLEPVGNGARIIGTTAQTTRLRFGQIDYDPERSRHYIHWNRNGCLALEQYKRDAWDTKFYYAMAQWVRQREQGPS